MHPVLFQLNLLGHAVPFYTYGFFLGWALFAAAQANARLGELDGIARKRMFQHAAIVIAAGYFGGHFHYILTQPPARRDFGDMLSLRYDGFTFYGAILSGLLGALGSTRLLKIPFWSMGDPAGVAMALALGIGRIGCFMRGCDYGVLATGRFAWIGVSFPKDSPAWIEQVDRGLIQPDAPRALPVIPTQLLEVVVGLGLAAGLWLFLTRRPTRRAGSAFLAFWLVYGLLRASLELLRGDSDRGALLGVSTSTAIGLLSSTAALLLLSLPPLVRLRPVRTSRPADPS